VVNIVTGDGSAGAAIAAHPDVDKVAFTGSTEVGRLIVQAAAGNLKKVSLELGGKSPAIVFPDADLSVVIPGAANGIFFNMGQCCTAGSRLFVHNRVCDKMMTGIADQASKIKIGPGLDPESRMGPLVSDEQFKRVTGFLDSGRQEGAEVVTGGKRHGNEGDFVEPTVLTRTTPEMKVVREEIFGPVVCAMPYDDDDLESHRQAGQRDRVRARRLDLDPRHRHRAQARAQAEGRLGVDQHPQLQRRGTALRWLQAIWLGARDGPRGDRAVYRNQGRRGVAVAPQWTGARSGTNDSRHGP
jgi:Aldehyde dehydrogenase family